MTDPRSCWAPAPLRPLVPLALVREYVYEYAAVSPQDGALDFMTAKKMNTESMNRFLDQVRKAHPDDFLVMITDGASSHKAKGLNIPERMPLIYLPPYSPELNPVELLWNILRRDHFANRVFDSLKSAILQAETGLTKMAADRSSIRSLTNWPWINATLNANQNYFGAIPSSFPVKERFRKASSLSFPHATVSSKSNSKGVSSNSHVLLADGLDFILSRD